MKIRQISWLIIAGLAFVIPPATIPGHNELAGAQAVEKSVWSRFTAKERKRLEAGDAIYQYVQSKGEDGMTHGHARSSAVINAPLDRCFKIFCEFDQHHLYFPRKIKSEIIKTRGNESLVHNEFDFYLVTVEYTSRFTVDTKIRRVDYDMDPDYEHDIEDTEGYFHFEKIDDTRTLFTYAATKVDTGLKVPGFVMEYLTSRDLPNVVLNVKKRIESGGQWTKHD